MNRILREIFSRIMHRVHLLGILGSFINEIILRRGKIIAHPTPRTVVSHISDSYILRSDADFMSTAVHCTELITTVIIHDENFTQERL